jgi:parallel beta-helix repeat protein
VLIFVTIPQLVTAASQIPDFYYYYDEKVQLNVSTEMITVHFKETVSQEQKLSVISSDPTLKDISPKKLPRKLFSIVTKDGLAINDIAYAIERLNKLPEIKYTTPVFKYRDMDLILMDEFVVRFKPDMTEQAIQELNTENGVEIIAKSPYRHNRYVLRVVNPKAENAVEIANIYNNSPHVKYASPSFAVIGGYVSTFPDDTYFDEQWALHNIGQDPPAGTPNADMDAPEGWDITTGNSDIIIAIIDSGTDINHEDLADNIIGGYDFEDDDNDPSSTNAHGTACAGLAGAIGNNSKGIAGICWSVKIMPLKIGTSVPITSAAADAIDYASANGADVLSNSWSVPPNSDLTDAIEDAKNNGRNGKGCILLAASGNGYGAVTYPATLSNTIAVGATDEDDVRWSYSNYGNELDVVASSSNGSSTIFWTTDITGSAGYNSGSTSQGDAAGNYTKWFGGTSAATPQVAGLAGLILSINPNLTSNEVQEIIEITADDLGDSGWDQYYGWGRINIYSALIEAGGLSLSVYDGLGSGDCVGPGDYIEYQISYSNPLTDPNQPGYIGDANDLVITDYLPNDVDVYSAFPPGRYDPNEHTYTWDIGLLSPGEGSALVLVVQVSETIEPLSEIVNTVELTCDVSRSWVTEETPVCCFGGGVIYVDASASSPDPNGSNWHTAYDNLADALTAATICDQVWVADGTYKPTTNPDNHKAAFSMLKGVGVFGGFSGDEAERYQRNWLDNETILSGVINSPDDEPNCASYVVVADANNVPCVLDGFTITGGSGAGVYCQKSSPVIGHNRITDNAKGIYCFESIRPVINNNWLYRNDYGLYFESPTDVAAVRNNTIANNTEMGIYLEAGSEPNISNCIFAGHPEDNDLVGCYATYSYIEYPIILDPNTTPPAIGLGNIDGDPNYTLFVDGDNDNYLLDSGSSCIDAGDPCGSYDYERDIDKHFRVLDGDGDGREIVDMGADEYCDQGSSNVADFNDDDIVDTDDLCELAQLWLADANDPSWDETYDLYDDDVIDYSDFAYFAQEWLWMT